MKLKYLALLLVLINCSSRRESREPEISTPLQFGAISLLGDSLYSALPSEELLKRYDTAKENYDNESSPENLIWLGRFTAYRRDYMTAIKIFTEGIESFPADPRFYRHRGHRYITIREFDLAIKDLSFAAQLIDGTENQVEPDGQPNAQNIPISTTHGNIWYHLGLAFYLKQDWDNALDAYKNCLLSSKYPDNVASSTHWLYMISRRMGNDTEAEELLDNIFAEMKIIENFSYHRLCLFYKGELAEDELLDEGAEASSNDAVLYGLANWYFYNGNKDRAKEIMEEILEKDSWHSFGYIAAEADYANYFSE